jgi:hypothetical protein
VEVVEKILTGHRGARLTAGRPFRPIAAGWKLPALLLRLPLTEGAACPPDRAALHLWAGSSLAEAVLAPGLFDGWWIRPAKSPVCRDFNRQALHLRRVGRERRQPHQAR